MCSPLFRTINIQLQPNVIGVSAVKITLAVIHASILQCSLLNDQFRGAVIHFWHLAFILDLFAILVPLKFTFSPSWDRRGVGKKEETKGLFLKKSSVPTDTLHLYQQKFSLAIQWNRNDSPLHNSKTSSPTRKSCLRTMISVFASREREEEKCHPFLLFSTGLQATTPGKSSRNLDPALELILI